MATYIDAKQYHLNYVHISHQENTFIKGSVKMQSTIRTCPDNTQVADAAWLFANIYKYLNSDVQPVSGIRYFYIVKIDK